MSGSGAFDLPTMNCNVNLFGQTITQMIQSVFSFQTSIEELRGQFRSLQERISNISTSMEDFEDKMFIKLQEVRPVIYTRDGIPIDDAIESMELKIKALVEKTSEHDDHMSKLDEQMDGKVDAEIFERDVKDSEDHTSTIEQLVVSLQKLQKDVVQQREESESQMTKILDTVHTHLSIVETKYDAPEIPLGNYVSHEELKEELKKLKLSAMSVETDDECFDPNDVEGTFARLQDKQDKLEREYLANKEKLNEQYGKVIAAANLNDKESEEEFEEFDEVEFEEEFDFVFDSPVTETEYQSIGLDTNDNIEVGDIVTHMRSNSGKRRNIGIIYNFEEAVEVTGDGTRKKRVVKKPKTATKLREKMKSSRSKQESESIDIEKLRTSITKSVLARVENLLVETLSDTGVGGVHFEKGDANQLLKELQQLSTIQSDLSKVKSIMNIKYDRAEAIRELDVRITRDEFLQTLYTIFPNNQTLAKMCNKEKVTAARPQTPMATQVQGTTQGQNQALPHNRALAQTAIRPVRRATSRTAVTASLAPSRDSRFMSFNKRYLNGTDGHYYIRDIGTANGEGTQNQSGTSSITADAALDFQPYVAKDGPRIEVPHEHRIQTPTVID